MIHKHRFEFVRLPGLGKRRRYVFMCPHCGHIRETSRYRFWSSVQ